MYIGHFKQKYNFVILDIVYNPKHDKSKENIK